MSIFWHFQLSSNLQLTSRDSHVSVTPIVKCATPFKLMEIWRVFFVVMWLFSVVPSAVPINGFTNKDVFLYDGPQLFFSFLCYHQIFADPFPVLTFLFALRASPCENSEEKVDIKKWFFFNWMWKKKQGNLAVLALFRGFSTFQRFYRFLAV